MKKYSVDVWDIEWFDEETGRRLVCPENLPSSVDGIILTVDDGFDVDDDPAVVKAVSEELKKTYEDRYTVLECTYEELVEIKED